LVSPIEALIEPKEPALQQAALRLVENVENTLDNKLRHKPVDILRAKFEMREAIDTLAEAKLWPYFGTFYRLIGFKLDGDEPRWDHGYDGVSEPSSVDGVGFCKMLMIALTDQEPLDERAATIKTHETIEPKGRI